jgi:quinol monooxygenase YgiN
MTLEWHVPVAQVRCITMALHAVAEAVRAVPGCLRCAVSTDIERDGTIRYVEDWATEDGLRTRLASDTFEALSRLIEDAVRPPRIQFALAGGYRHADFLTEVRDETLRVG